MAKLMAATLLSKCPCKSGNKSRFRKFVHERKVFTALTAFLLEEPDQLQRSRECFISSREKCRMVSPEYGVRELRGEDPDLEERAGFVQVAVGDCAAARFADPHFAAAGA